MDCKVTGVKIRTRLCSRSDEREKKGERERESKIKSREREKKPDIEIG